MKKLFAALAVVFALSFGVMAQTPPAGQAPPAGGEMKAKTKKKAKRKAKGKAKTSGEAPATPPPAKPKKN